MKSTIYFFLVLVVIDNATAQCGCRKKMLMKRSEDVVQVGDMILDKVDIAIIHGFKHRQRNVRPWNGGNVLFAFANDFPQQKQGLVRNSLAELQRDVGCIRFHESTNGHFVEVHSIYGRGCYSMIGMTDGRSQYLNLDDSQGCLGNGGIIKHEFIHALGFMHTHMRSDRDRFIRIHWNNVRSDQCSNFILCQGCINDGPYETNSVMHYSSDAFGCQRGALTMTTVNGQQIGYNFNTTPNDLRMIRNLYGC